MGLMTMQAQVRAVRARPVRVAPRPGVMVPSGGALAIAAPFARLPFVVQPAPRRVVGWPGELRVPADAVLRGEESNVAPQSLLETVLVIGGVIVIAAIVAGGLYAACRELDKYNAAVCKANCGNTPCDKSNCVAVGVCCTYTCPNSVIAPGNPLGGGP